MLVVTCHPPNMPRTIVGKGSRPVTDDSLRKQAKKTSVHEPHELSVVSHYREKMSQFYSIYPLFAVAVRKLIQRFSIYLHVDVLFGSYCLYVS
jgi:hypothetical protein